VEIPKLQKDNEFISVFLRLWNLQGQKLSILKMLVKLTSDCKHRKNVCTKNFLFEKTACKMFVKLSPVVNFTNILRVAFATFSFHQKLAK